MATEKKAPEMAEEEMDRDPSEVRVYELGFHLDPELSQDEVKKGYAKVRESISNVGTVVAEGEPTKVPLAYTISIQNTTGRRDFDSAFFCWIAYEADGPAHEKVQADATGNKSIIRFIDLRTTKEGAQHSAEMHEIFANAALLEEQERQREEDEDAMHSSAGDEFAPEASSEISAETPAEAIA